MSRKLFAFLLSELGIFRIHCKSCKAAIEMPPAAVAQRQWLFCPICRASFDPMLTQKDAIAAARAAIAKVQEASAVFDVEFVLPEEGK